MTAWLFVAASLAGGVGAVLRYLVDQGVARMLGRRMPWGTMLINVTGSFALGFVTGALPEHAVWIGAGLLGGYTTFSTAMLDALQLWKSKHRGRAIASLAGTLGVSALAAGAGLALAGGLA